MSVNVGTGNYFIVLDKRDLNHVHILCLCFLYEGHEHNAPPDSSEQHCDNIRGAGNDESISLHFCIFQGKMCQTPKYKSEVLAPKSGIKCFNLSLGILKKKKSG